MELADSLASALVPVIEPLGVDIDSIDIVRSGRHRSLQISLDSDLGVDLDTVAAATRLISAWLDDSDVMGEQPYVLEVSSRGVGRPLTRPEHWRRNVGRLLAMTVDGKPMTARLLAFEEPIATVDDGRAQCTVNIATVSRAVVEVEFNRTEEH